MTEFRADLHCHTTCSDGSDHPQVLLRLAKQIGLQGLSITDHDTMDAYTPELIAEAEQLGLRLLPGIEISSELDDTAVHILAYGYDLHDAGFKEFLIEMQKRRNERNRAILQRLAARKMVITEEELRAYATERSIGRPHHAHAQLMVKKGYVQSIREAFDRYLREGGLSTPPALNAIPATSSRKFTGDERESSLGPSPPSSEKGPFLRKILVAPSIASSVLRPPQPKTRAPFD